MNIIGKTVNTKDVGLISFFYPNFIVKEELFFDFENDVIYTGKYEENLSTILQKNTRNFISTVGRKDYDFDSKEVLLEFVYSKYNKTPKETVLDAINYMTDKEFETYIKKYWVCGSSKLDEKNKYSIFDLYVAMCKSAVESLKIFSALSTHYDTKVLTRSIETFLEKVINVENVDAKGRYAKVLYDFNSRYRKILKDTLFKYYQLDDAHDNYKIMWLLYQFGG